MNPSAVGVAPLSPIQLVNGILLVVAVTELVKLLVVLYLHRCEVS